MTTERLSASSEPLGAALTQLRAGAAVAVATESFYALAVDATSRMALDALFALKPRDASKGIGLVVPRTQDWRQWVNDPAPLVETLIEHFWPGPLTLVLPAATGLDERLVVRGHVALRMPGPSPIQDLVDAWGGPLTATSANRSGQAPCRTSEEVHEQFASNLGPGLLVLEGQAQGGQVSSLVRVERHGVEFVREGAVTRHQAESVVHARLAKRDC